MTVSIVNVISKNIYPVPAQRSNPIWDKGMAWGSQCLIFGLSRCCDVSHTLAWLDIICHLLHLPVLFIILWSPWYLLIHHSKMSLEIFFYYYFLSHFASGSIWFSLRFKRMWPLIPSSVADWALWDANWPCNNTSNCDIVPCKIGKTHCRLISVANSYSSDHNLYEAGHFFQRTYFNKKPVSILQPYLCWEISPSVFKTRQFSPSFTYIYLE